MATFARPVEAQMEAATLLPWREIGVGAAAGGALGRLVGDGAPALLVGLALGATAGAAYGLLAPPSAAFRPTRAAGDLASRERRPDGEPSELETPAAAGARTAVSEEDATDPAAEGDASEAPAAGGAPDYEAMTKAELYEEAQRLDISGRSAMNKAELLEAVLEHARG